MLCRGGIGNTQVWERASGRQIAVLPHFDVSLAHRELWIYGVGLSSNGARAYTAGQDGALAIWDVATQTEIHRIAAHKDAIMALAVTRVGEDDGALRAPRCVADGVINAATLRRRAADTAASSTPPAPSAGPQYHRLA